MQQELSVRGNASRIEVDDVTDALREGHSQFQDLMIIQPTPQTKGRSTSANDLKGIEVEKLEMLVPGAL